jgi:TatD DNase family protein
LMKLIDTHTHIYLPEFDTDRDEAVSRALDNGIVRLLLPNIDTQSVEPMLSAADRFPGICIPMIGLHPTSVKEDYKDQLESLEKLWPEHNFIAIGEIGIDLYWDKTFIKEQIHAFRRQISFAIEKNAPIVVHSRDSFAEVFSVLREFEGKGLKGVLHAFTGTLEDARRAISMGFMLGIGGIVTFKNSGLDMIVKETGPGNLILETDSPYLAPVPHRGKRNESSYLGLINKKLADVFGMDEEEVASITYDNSVRLFNPEEWE